MLGQWLKDNFRRVFLSIDSISGVIVFIGLAVGGIANHKVIPGLGALYSEIALAAAVLSVALLAQSVVIAFLGEKYLRFLDGQWGANDLQLWKLLEGREVESGLGEEPLQQAGLVLHPPQPRLDQRRQLADVVLDQVGQ